MHSQSSICVSDAVNGSLDLSRFGSVVLHDVDLAPAWPGDAVIAHHPERRPDGLASWNLNAGFDSAVGEFLAKAAVQLCLDAGREVGSARQVGLDDQVPIAIQEGGCAVGDHVFDLAGAENTLTGFESPELVVAAGRCER